jgi:hypothetical protein
MSRRPRRDPDVGGIVYPVCGEHLQAFKRELHDG